MKSEFEIKELLYSPFFALTETQFSAKIKILRLDNAHEFSMKIIKVKKKKNLKKDQIENKSNLEDIIYNLTKNRVSFFLSHIMQLAVSYKVSFHPLYCIYDYSNQYK